MIHGDRSQPSTGSQPAIAVRRRIMADVKVSSNVSDRYDLNRFVQAQEGVYERALAEVKNGRKRSHWMWYIFPQFQGLGFSAMSQRYAIESVAEAKAYLNHPILGSRLIECIEAALSVEGRSAYEIFGSPDDMKLKSCATLFAYVSPEESVFEQLLNKFFNGDRDHKTLELLANSSNS
jgi:uncharacterized protein (DUF1810 family)